MIQASLSILIKDWKILLWEKKTGFAKGVLNWVWGKQEQGETMEECMIREAREEIGIEVSNPEKVAVLHFYFTKKPEYNIEVHVFLTPDYTWNINESKEIKPFWFDLNKIPYDKMWKDDIIWLPRILAWEKDIEYDIWFDDELGDIEKYEVIK